MFKKRIEVGLKMKGKIYLFNGINEDIEFKNVDELRKSIRRIKRKYNPAGYVKCCVSNKFALFVSEVTKTTLSESKSFIPGQSDNVNYKLASFDDKGNLHKFDDVLIRIKEDNIVYG